MKMTGGTIPRGFAIVLGRSVPASTNTFSIVNTKTAY